MNGTPKRGRASVCSVYFPAGGPRRLEDTAYLESRGLRISPADFDGAEWAIDLEHPRWGAATLACMPQISLPPREVLDCTCGLSDDDRASIASAANGLQLFVEPGAANVLRERKTMLRFAGAVMGDTGLAVADHASQLFWTPKMLEDELCHDADLDITGVFVTHAVYDPDAPRKEDEDAPTRWMHTHGLAELGAFDFDILRPTDDLHGAAYDGVRALAFAIVEGEAAPDEPRFRLAFPRGEVALVRADVFQVRASKPHAALRDHDESHSSDRVVLCDPPARGPLAMLRKGPRPSRFLSREIGDHTVFQFTKNATALMAERARNTFGVFQSLFAELARFEFPALVKLGYETDLGNGSHEHLWFQVNAVRDSTVDATLVNSPHAIARMKEGDRGEHAAERLTDWTIMTPLGAITPRDLRGARMIREDPEKVAQLVAMMRAMGLA